MYCHCHVTEVTQSILSLLSLLLGQTESPKVVHYQPKYTIYQPKYTTNSYQEVKQNIQCSQQKRNPFCLLSSRLNVILLDEGPPKTDSHYSNVWLPLSCKNEPCHNTATLLQVVKLLHFALPFCYYTLFFFTLS